jgi:hypothetical protein
MKENVEYGFEGGSAGSAQLGACMVQLFSVHPQSDFASFVQAVPFLNENGMYGTLIRVVCDDKYAEYMRNLRRVAAVIFNVTRQCDQHFDNWRTRPSTLVIDSDNHQKLVVAIAEALASDRCNVWNVHKSCKPAEIKW